MSNETQQPPDCNGKGYTYVKVGKRVLRSPCYCTNAEAAKLKSDKERLNKEIKKRDEKRWN